MSEKIRKHLTKDNPELLLKEAERFEFKEKKDEAIDAYLDYIFCLKNKDIDTDEKRSNINKAIYSIESMGGKVPERIKKIV